MIQAIFVNLFRLFEVEGLAHLIPQHFLSGRRQPELLAGARVLNTVWLHRYSYRTHSAVPWRTLWWTVFRRALRRAFRWASRGTAWGATAHLDPSLTETATNSSSAPHWRLSTLIFEFVVKYILEAFHSILPCVYCFLSTFATLLWEVALSAGSLRALTQFFLRSFMIFHNLLHERARHRFNFWPHGRKPSSNGLWIVSTGPSVDSSIFGGCVDHATGALLLRLYVFNSPVLPANRRPVERIERVNLQVVRRASTSAAVHFITRCGNMLIKVESRAACRSEHSLWRELCRSHISALFGRKEMSQYSESAMACTHLTVTQALSVHLLAIHSSPALHLLLLMCSFFLFCLIWLILNYNS